MSLSINDKISSTSSFEAIRYDESQTLASIQSIRERGKKVGLFIGRRPFEKLPEEEDTVWISLDLTTKVDRKNPGKVDPKRLHLLMDFNKKEDLKKIAHLFDKVVVDLSTMKLFDGSKEDSISKLVSLLDPNPEKQALLIFESSKPSTMISTQDMIEHCMRQLRELHSIQMENRKKPDEWSYKFFLCNENLTTFLSLYEFLPKGPESWLQRDERLNQKSILYQFFKNVSDEIYQPFPYPSRYCKGQSDFFVCSGLKTPSLAVTTSEK